MEQTRDARASNLLSAMVMGKRGGTSEGIGDLENNVGPSVTERQERAIRAAR
jgi:hypothetical protein